MFTEMFNYKMWADKRTLQTIEKVNKNLFPDSYLFSRQQINHMVIVEELFKSRLTNSPAPHASTNTEIVPEFQILQQRVTESGKWYLDYIARLEKWNNQISFVFADGKRGTMSVEEILFHIVNHGTYHRGSIAYALDLASVSHPVDGYAIYVHESQPSLPVLDT